MLSLNETLNRFAHLGPLVIRVILGGLFLLHGIDKFDTGLDTVEGFFASNDVPAAGLTSGLVAVLEIALGITLIVGLVTRLSALVLAVILVGAIVFVKAGQDILGGAELDLAYLSGLAALVLMGPGPLSADEALKLDRTTVPADGTGTAPVA